jgi:hypothetical protein
VHREFWWKNLREGDHLKNLDLDGTIILKRIPRQIGRCGVDWIRLAEDREKWQAVVNQLSGSIKCGEILEYMIKH